MSTESRPRKQSCGQCKYWSAEPILPCAVHPLIEPGAWPTDCPDFEKRDRARGVLNVRIQPLQAVGSDSWTDADWEWARRVIAQLVSQLERLSAARVTTQVLNELFSDDHGESNES